LPDLLLSLGGEVAHGVAPVLAPPVAVPQAEAEAAPF
jgi:hypothetical protein